MNTVYQTSHKCPFKDAMMSNKYFMVSLRHVQCAHRDAVISFYCYKSEYIAMYSPENREIVLAQATYWQLNVESIHIVLKEAISQYTQKTIKESSTTRS